MSEVPIRQLARVESFKARIKALPPEQKDELQRLWPAGVPKNLNDRTPTELDKIEQAIVSVTPFEDADGVDAERVAELAAKLKSLPSDLYESVTREGVAANVPNLGSPALTDEHLVTLDGLLEQALGKHFTRVISLGKAVAALDYPFGTDLLEALCAFVTGMRERDPNRLTHEQARDLEAATRLIAHGALEVTQTNGGKPQVSLAIDWKGEAKRRGQSQRDLLVHAKGIAERLGLPAPKNLTELRPAVIYELLPWEARDQDLQGPDTLQHDGTSPAVVSESEGGAGHAEVPAPASELGYVDFAKIKDDTERGDRERHVYVDHCARLLALLATKPDEILGVVEEVRRLPGALAARVVLRVPLDLVEQIPEKLYVRRVS